MRSAARLSLKGMLSFKVIFVTAPLRFDLIVNFISRSAIFMFTVLLVLIRLNNSTSQSDFSGSYSNFVLSFLIFCAFVYNSLNEKKKRKKNFLSCQSSKACSRVSSLLILCHWWNCKFDCCCYNVILGVKKQRQ